MASSKACASNVRDILRDDWNPIDASVPRDEYDTFVPRLVGRLSARAPVVEIAAELLRVERQAFGLPGDAASTARVAARLVAIPLPGRLRRSRRVS